MINIDIDTQMLKEWGRAFVIIPREIIKRMYHPDDPLQRKLGKLHFTLFCFCYHTDGYVKLTTNRYKCRQGEYIGTYKNLATLSGIHVGYIGKLLKKLVNEKQLSIKKLEGGSRIRVNGYSDFVQGKFPEKNESCREDSPEEAFARYLKAIQEGQYINRTDF